MIVKAPFGSTYMHALVTLLPCLSFVTALNRKRETNAITIEVALGQPFKAIGAISLAASF